MRVQILLLETNFYNLWTLFIGNWWIVRQELDQILRHRNRVNLILIDTEVSIANSIASTVHCFSPVVPTFLE